MTAGVFSHHGAPRKRAPSRGWTARRVLAMALTLAALAAIAWVAPHLRPEESKSVVSPAGPRPEPVAAPPPLALPIAAETIAPVHRARAPRRQSGIPLDANPANPGEDYEVLSASELDAISQAQD